MTKTVQYEGWTVYEGVSWKYDKKSLTVKMFPSRQYPKKMAWKAHEKTWKNYCPSCKKEGVLRAIGAKGLNTALEGELDCTNCTDDFDGVQGYRKFNGSKVHLTPGSSTSTSKITSDLAKITEDTKKEYTDSKSAKRNMTLKIPPLKGIKDGHCHQLSPPLVSKDMIVYVESVEITEKEVVMKVNNRLEPPGEPYNPPSEKSSGSGSTYNATTKAEKEIVAKGQELKKASDSETVRAIFNWLKDGGGNFNYAFYYDWPGGDWRVLNKTALGKRWNMKSGNCVYFSHCFYVMCKGAGIDDVEVWGGKANFSKGRLGHAWNKYKGIIIDCSVGGWNQTYRNYQGSKFK